MKSSTHVRCALKPPGAKAECGAHASIILGKRPACAPCAMREIIRREDLYQGEVADFLRVRRETLNRVIRCRQGASDRLMQKIRRWVLTNV